MDGTGRAGIDPFGVGSWVGVMYEVTITITRLFDIHRRPAARFNSKHTVFGFETNEFKKPFVRVDGWPRLEVGDTLVVLLAKKDDWQSIYGWKNKATGQVCAASLSRSASNFGIAIALAAPFVYAVLDNSSGHPLWSPFWALVFCSVAMLHLWRVIQTIKVRGVLEAA